MACVRKRRGAWIMDIHLHGKRVIKTYQSREEAESALATVKKERAQKRNPVVSPFITLSDYTERFYASCQSAEMAPSSFERYQHALNNHILPTLGKLKIRDITRGE